MVKVIITTVSGPVKTLHSLFVSLFTSLYLPYVYCTCTDLFVFLSAFYTHTSFILYLTNLIFSLLSSYRESRLTRSCCLCVFPFHVLNRVNDFRKIRCEYYTLDATPVFEKYPGCCFN
jgi:hypothetical protein